MLGIDAAGVRNRRSVLAVAGAGDCCVREGQGFSVRIIGDTVLNRVFVRAGQFGATDPNAVMLNRSGFWIDMHIFTITESSTVVIVTRSGAIIVLGNLYLTSRIRIKCSAGNSRIVALC